MAAHVRTIHKAVHTYMYVCVHHLATIASSRLALLWARPWHGGCNASQQTSSDADRCVSRGEHNNIIKRAITCVLGFARKGQRKHASQGQRTNKLSKRTHRIPGESSLKQATPTVTPRDSAARGDAAREIQLLHGSVPNTTVSLQQARGTLGHLTW